MLLACGALPHGTMFAPRPVAGPGGEPTPRVLMNPKCFALADGGPDAARARFIAALPPESTARRLYTEPSSLVDADDARLRAEFDWQVSTLGRCLDEHLRRRQDRAEARAPVVVERADGREGLGARLKRRLFGPRA